MQTDESIGKNLENCYQNFSTNPNLDNREKLVESLIETCKFYAQESDLEGFEKTFNAIRKFTDLESDTRTCEKLSEIFPILTSKIQDKIVNDSDILDRIYNMILELKIGKPGEYYSNLYRSVHRFRKIWKGYIEFCRWWGFENFTQYDFFKEEESGNKALRMSLAEAALIGYTKRLEKTNFQEDIAKLAMTFIAYSQNYKMTVYTNYYIAKLLLRLKINNLYIRRILKPYILAKHSKPWTWGILAKTFNNHEYEQKYSCILMALHYSKDFEPKIYCNIYYESAVMFYDLGNYGKSKYMLEKYLNISKGTKNQRMIEKIKSNEDYQISESIRPETNFNYKENCRNILRNIENPDRELWVLIYRYLRDNFKETIQWSQDWYATI